MRRAAKTDRPHAAIVAALRQLGAEVLDLSAVGRGCPDLAVQFRGAITFLEVKDRRGRLTAAQVAFQRRWRVMVVRSVAEALTAVRITAMT
jgi:hypothetical protein